MSASESRLPLDGVRVIALEQVVALEQAVSAPIDVDRLIAAGVVSEPSKEG